MGYPVLRSIVDQRTYRLAATPRHHAYVWRTTNMLLRDYPGAIGIKTGSTLAAGYCLLFEARENGHALIGVVLHSSRNNDTGQLRRCDEDPRLGLPARLACKTVCRPLDSIRWRVAQALPRHLWPSGGRNTWDS